MDLNRYVLGYQRNTTMKVYLGCLAARYVRSAVRALGPMRSRAARSRPRSMTLSLPPTWQRPRCRRSYLIQQTSRYATASYIHNWLIRSSIVRNPSIPSHIAVLQAPPRFHRMPSIAKHLFPVDWISGDSDIGAAMQETTYK